MDLYSIGLWESMFIKEAWKKFSTIKLDEWFITDELGLLSLLVKLYHDR